MTLPYPEHYYSILGIPSNQWINYYGFYDPNSYYFPDYYLYSNAYFDPNESFQLAYYGKLSQAVIKGQATWTYGGKTTKCGIPWSQNNYMTTAVATNSPFKCGQTLRVKNLSIPSPKEVVVTVVDTVADFPANNLNLHKNAFEALGSPASVGVINIEITPTAQTQEEYAKWGKLLLELTKKAHPNYNVVDYEFVGSQNISEDQTKETFDYLLQSAQQKLRVRANVIFNPKTERIISINFEELPLK